MNFSSLEELRKYTNEKAEQAKSLGSSLGKWVAAGLPVVEEKKLNQRIAICHACSMWDEKGFGGTGSCKKCGCSTQAKLRMDSEVCPEGKW